MGLAFLLAHGRRVLLPHLLLLLALLLLGGAGLAGVVVGVHLTGREKAAQPSTPTTLKLASESVSVISRYEPLNLPFPVP